MSLTTYSHRFFAEILLPIQKCAKIPHTLVLMATLTLIAKKTTAISESKHRCI